MYSFRVSLIEDKHTRTFSLYPCAPSGRVVIASVLLFILSLCLDSGRMYGQETTTLDPEVEQGLDDGEFPPVALQYQSVVSKDSVEFNHTQLTGWGSSVVTLAVLDEPLEHQCIECEITEAKLKVELRMGSDDYTFGRTDFSNGSLDVTVLGYLNGAPQSTYGPVTLTINEKEPQQRQVFDFLANSDVDEFRISVSNYTSPTHPTNSTITSSLETDIRLKVYYEQEIVVDAVHSSQPTTPLVEPTPLGASGAGWTRVSTNPLTLSWSLASGCTDDQFPTYQLQLLRLFNRDPLYVNADNISDGRVHDTVDWTRALTIETGSKALSQVLTIAEGTGYYVWRVRPIGDKYPGGIANDRNWGVWSEAPSQGDVIDIPDITGSASIDLETDPPTSETRSNKLNGGTFLLAKRNAIFFYGTFDDDKNWIYSRTFSEGDADGSTGVRIGESITYASYLLRQSQTQAHSRSTNTVLLSETFYDHNGRAAVQTMAAPRTWSKFEYDASFIEGFGTDDFDADATVMDPDPIPNNTGITTELVDYYSTTYNSDQRIPDAEGYPYSRTLWYPDASGRICEVGGVGSVHRIGGHDLNAAPQQSHTIQYHYASAFESELIAMFGNEAPNPMSVRTIYAVDQNKVTSVSYVDDKGQTLATALVKVGPTDNPYLDADLTNEATYSGESITTLDAGWRSGDEYHLTSRLMIESPNTDVSLSYAFTPEVLDLRPCPTIDFCETCDYMLYVRITNAKDPSDVAYDDSIDIYDVIETRQLDLCNAVEPVRIVIATDGTSDDLPVIAGFANVGSYIVDVWMRSNRRDATDPTGLNRRYVDVWSNELRDELRSSMDARLNTLYAFLDEPIPDIDGFYGQLETWSTNEEDVEEIIEEGKTVAYVVKGVNGNLEFTEETCWEIAIPVLECTDNPTCDPDGDDDIYDGNGDLDVDYEGMLYDKWGPGGYVFTDENNGTHDFGDTPEKYFRRDGEPLYKDEVDDPNDPNDPYYPNDGKGAFNDMIKAMIADGYDCGTLLLAWTGLVEGFGAMATKDGDGDPRKLSPNFDLMETFLNLVGREFEGVSDCQYGDCGDDANSDEEGYLKYAYKYFQYTIGSNTDCEAPIIADNGPISGWNADDANDIFKYQPWLRLYQCIRGDQRHEKIDELIDLDGVWCGDCDLEDPGNLACMWELKDSIENRCESICEWRADGFRRGIRKMYHDAGFAIEGDRTMPDGEPITENATIITIYDVECKVEMLVARCKDDCVLTLYDASQQAINSDESSQTVKWFGDSAGVEMAKFQKVYSSSFSVGLSDSGQCVDSGMESLTERGNAENAIINAMNQKLQRYRHDVMIADTGSAESYFWYIRDSIYLETMRQSGRYDSQRDSGCVMEFWDIWPDWGNGSGVITEVEDDNPFDRDCCPPMAMPETFTFDEALNGEFFLHEEWDPVNNIHSSSLYYRRTCNRNGQIYMHEQLLCDAFTDCYEPATSIEEEKGAQTQALLPENDCSCEDTICFRWDDPTITSAIAVSPLFCEAALAAQLRAEIEMQAASVIEAEVGAFRSEYDAKCLTPTDDTLRITKETELYHFTLFYYDRAGNMVRTVPPGGVQLLTEGLTRADDSPLSLPAHTLFTTYEFNSLRQLVARETPDAGRTTHWYDAIGRHRLSQDAQQNVDDMLMYKRFDALGRTVENGVAPQPVPLSGETLAEALVRSADDEAFPDPQYCDERTYTIFSWAFSTTNQSDPGYLDHNEEYIDGTLQRFTLNRVAHVYTDEGVHTQYSYDPHGNVEWVRQEIPGLGSNFVRSEYDLIGGQMLGMSYNEGWVDQYFHRMRYDEDGRLKEVMSSRDREIWDSDARYYYYQHGSVSRVEYGEDNLQGVDFIYTINGWLKAINHPLLIANSNLDPGQDGKANGTGVNEHANDAFGMVLTYFSGDFSRGAFDSRIGGSWAIKKYNLVPSKHLYNGNIATWTNRTQSPALAPFGLTLPPPPTRAYDTVVGHKYEYDVLGRLKNSTFYRYQTSASSPSWFARLGYNEQFGYDPNGNILSMLRKGVGTDAYTGAPTADMDDFVYNYTSGTNRLSSVDDNTAYSANYTDDIDDQAANNYQYDANGNLIIDAAEGITGLSGDVISWTAYGKVKSVVKSSGDMLTFMYDAMGNRVKKTFDPVAGDPQTTYYVYEASGKVLAIYDEECKPAGLVPADQDHDGYPDVGVPGIGDNCPTIWNPDQADMDNDLIGDACDGNIDGDQLNNNLDNCDYDPADQCGFPSPYADTDSDGLVATDPCPNYPEPDPINPSYVDQDNDGLPDQCDPDIDGDGDANDHDNCPYNFNPNQEDLDEDDIGDACDCMPKLSEWLIYGSASDGRVATAKPLGGIHRMVPRADTLISIGLYTRIVGEKEYELSDHLGNARVVFNDRKDGLTNPGRAPFVVEMVAYNNYYAFGMPQPERCFNSAGHRYGFNGMEVENEVASGSAIVAAYYRFYESRVGMWLSVDPKAADQVSPYMAMAGNPILLSDPLGDTVRGTNAASTNRMIELLLSGFTYNPNGPSIGPSGSDDNPARPLFVVGSDGRTLKSVSPNDFYFATSTMTPDQQDLAYGLYGLVNSGELHYIEVARISEALSTTVRLAFMNESIPVDQLKTGADFAEKIHPSGANISSPTRPYRVSVSVVILHDGYQRELKYYNENPDEIEFGGIDWQAPAIGETLIHEVLGHGGGYAENGSLAQTDALQAGNLYRRATGVFGSYRIGDDHPTTSGRLLTSEEANSVMPRFDFRKVAPRWGVFGGSN